MMAGILIIYIPRVIFFGEITCVIFNLGQTRASKAFFDAKHMQLLGTLEYARCSDSDFLAVC